MQAERIQLVKGLYWQNYKPTYEENPNCFIIDIDKSWSYAPVIKENGTYHIGEVYIFSLELDQLMRKAEVVEKEVIHVNQGSLLQKTNSILLIGAYCIIRYGLRPQDLSQKFASIRLIEYEDFTVSQVKLSVVDYWNALEFAIHKNWFCYKTFNLQEYNKLAVIGKGDLNWIIPNEICAFSGPVDINKDANEGTISSEMMGRLLSSIKVKSVFRLNEVSYDKANLERFGIRHYDYCYADGSIPDEKTFIACMEDIFDAPLPIGVHCKAGIGRTGTVIGSYLILKYKMSAKNAIAWMRLNRQGMVTAFQQDFLIGVEKDNQQNLEFTQSIVMEKKQPLVTEPITAKAQIKGSIESPVNAPVQSTIKHSRYKKGKVTPMSLTNSRCSVPTANRFTDKGAISHSGNAHAYIKYDHYSPKRRIISKFDIRASEDTTRDIRSPIKRSILRLDENQSQLRSTSRKVLDSRFGPVIVPKPQSKKSIVSLIDNIQLDGPLRESSRERYLSPKKEIGAQLKSVHKPNFRETLTTSCKRGYYRHKSPISIRNNSSALLSPITKPFYATSELWASGLRSPEKYPRRFRTATPHYYDCS